MLLASNVDPRVPSQPLARGRNHCATTEAFRVDLAAHHELVAILVRETDAASDSMPVEPPLCSPLAANAPNRSLPAEV